MKKIFKFSIALALAALMAVGCNVVKDNYVPAEPETGEQVYFPSGIPSSIDLDKNATSFEIPISRNSEETDAIDVVLTTSGDGAKYFTVPGVVSFANGEKTSSIKITYDPAEIGSNNFVPVTISIADEAMTTQYGLSSISFTAGIQLPWVKFDKGLLHEDCWQEEEPDKVVYIQEYRGTIVKCKIEKCWGHDTIEKGEPYDVQDYVWYWDQATNYCYIVPQYMGYNPGEGKYTYVSDACGFYNMYYAYGHEFMSEEYCEWAPKFLTKNGFSVPHYDGNGTFYLGDWFYYLPNKVNIEELTPDKYPAPTGNGLQFGGNQDYWMGENFIRTDYTFSVYYNGMYVNPLGEAFPIIAFQAIEDGDATGAKYFVTDQNTDPAETIALIEKGEDENIGTVEFTDGYAEEKISLEKGLYRIVAVPFGTDGVLQSADAQYTDFYYPGADSKIPEVDATLTLYQTSELFGSAAAAAGYYDYNSFAFTLKGSELKSVRQYINKTSVIISAAQQGFDIMTIILDYGTDISEKAISAIESKGYFGSTTSKTLDADTDYMVLMYIENIYGSKLILSKNIITASLPYSGELVIGNYNMKDGAGNDCPMILAATATENAFTLANLGFYNNSKWNAQYDSSANTLTLDGTENGYEAYGNLFGPNGYGYFDSANSMYYSIESYASTESKGDDPLVINVNPTTHELATLANELVVNVYYVADGSLAGTYASFAAGTEISRVKDTLKKLANKSKSLGAPLKQSLNSLPFETPSFSTKYKVQFPESAPKASVKSESKKVSSFKRTLSEVSFNNLSK